MTTTRRTILETAGALLERQGYHATGVSQILSECAVPRGSLYHHFPGGKEALAVAAIEDRARRTHRFVEHQLALRGDPAEAVGALVRALADRVEGSSGGALTPFAAVTLEAGPGLERLREACRIAYAGIRQRFERKLVDGGFAPARAASLATVIAAAVDGAVVLCRADGSAAPLRRTGAELEALLRCARPAEAPSGASGR